MTVVEGYRVHEWGALPVWEEFDLAEPAEGELEVAVEACGVGLTVLNCINGDLADERAALPVVPGHELVGRVSAVGPGVSNDRIGQRVVAYFYRYCDHCAECAAGRQSRCANLEGFVGVHSGGGYAPAAVVRARNAIAVPDALDPVQATVVADAVATPVHVCTRAQITAQDRVAVIGAGGGVGAHMLQVAALYGGRVAGLDVGSDKLGTIEGLGAVAVDSADFAAVEPSALWSDGGPTVVIDLLGSEESLAWSLAALGTGGRLVVLTTFPDRTTILDPRQLVFRETAVLGSRYASVDEVRTAAELVATGRVRPIIGETVEAKSVLDLHDALTSGRLVGRGALVW